MINLSYYSAKKPSNYNYRAQVEREIRDRYITDHRNSKVVTAMPGVTLEADDPAQAVVSAGKNTIYYILAVIGILYLPQILKSLKKITR